MKFSRCDPCTEPAGDRASCDGSASLPHCPILLLSCCRTPEGTDQTSTLCILPNLGALRAPDCAYGAACGLRTTGL